MEFNGPHCRQFIPYLSVEVNYVFAIYSVMNMRRQSINMGVNPFALRLLAFPNGNGNVHGTSRNTLGIEYVLGSGVWILQ